MSSLRPIVDYQVASFKEKFTRTWYFEGFWQKAIMTFFFVVGVFSSIYFIIKWFF